MSTWLKILLVLIAVLAVSVVIVQGLRYAELPAAASPERIEAHFGDELALLRELALELPPGKAGLEHDIEPGADDLAELERRRGMYDDIVDRGGAIDHPAILRLSVRAYDEAMNRVAVIFRAEFRADVEWPLGESAPEVGRPAVSLVVALSPRRRLVRYAEKVGEVDGVSRGFEIVFDAEALEALDAASPPPDPPSR
jgi:hypothetical protein